jgi:cell division protein FtsB
MAATHASLVRPHRRRQPRTWLTWGLAVVTTVILVDAVFGDEGYVSRLRARTEYARHVARLQRIRLDNLALQEQRRRLREDAGAIEETARQELGLIRRGEILFIVKDRAATPQAEPTHRAVPARVPSHGAVAQ